MFGRLPLFHQGVVLLFTLVVGILSGAWIAHFTSLEIAVSAGAFLGGVAGLLAAYLLIHDFHASRLRRRTVRRRSP